MLSLFLQVLEDKSDEEVFTKLYYEYEKFVLKVTYGILKDQYYAEDAAQEAWFGIARNFNSLEIENKQMIKGYILTAAKNSAFNVMSKNEKHDNLELKDYFEVEETAEDVLTSREEYLVLKEAIMKLSFVYKDVLVLSLLYGLRAKEIAITMKRSPSTIRSIIRRGKRILAKSLGQVKNYG